MKKFDDNKWLGLLVAGLITLFTFGGCLLSTMIFWGIGHVVGIFMDYWAMVEALATAVATAAVIGAAYFAYRELNEIAQTRYMEVADRLFQELNSAENTAARRWIYNHISEDIQNKPEEVAKILEDDDGRDMVKKVLNSLDRVAFLTQNGWIPDKLIMPWMNPMIVKIWEKIGPFVEFERQRRVHEPDYYKDAQALAEHCVAWRKETYGYEGFTWKKEEDVL